MSRTLLKIGFVPAFCAALILTLPGCSSSEINRWDADVQVEEEALEPVRFTESSTPGKLILTGRQKIRARKTPIERLTIVHEETYSDFDFDNAGLVFFSILGGILSVGLYFLFAFVVFDEPDEE